MKLVYTITMCFLLTLADIASSQDTASIDLRGQAAFRLGDDAVWMSKYIDEAEGWNFIPVPGAWEDHGFPLADGFAWYRIRFRLPASLRNDSLLLVMSGIHDADETFLNGVMVGRTGAFPPNGRLEPRSLRVYPLPKSVLEEFNLLAIRVYDFGDQGGITGDIFRIIRAQDIPTVLDEIVDAPPRPHSLYISNGIMVSAIRSDSAIVEWSRPRPYDRISMDLATQRALRRLEINRNTNGERNPIGRPLDIAYIERTGVVRADWPGSLNVYWYHPVHADARILVVATRRPVDSPDEIGITFVMEQPVWRYEERSTESAGIRTTYHILAHNACCQELVDRDMENFLSGGDQAWTIEAEIQRWKTKYFATAGIPSLLSEQEQQVYSQSLISIINATVRESGGGHGQILGGLEPQSRAICHAGDHLLAVAALATAGLETQALEGLHFLHGAEHGNYTFLDAYGVQRGIGFPYSVSPVPYDGSGQEWQWRRADEAELRFDGMPMYIQAVEALRTGARRYAIASEEHFSDSAFIAPYYARLSHTVADVLMYRLDSLGLLSADNSPWGDGKSDLPGIYSTIHASHALSIAAAYAHSQCDELRAFLYSDAAERSRATLKNLVNHARMAEHPDSLDEIVLRVFHPLLPDAVSLGLFSPISENARFALDMVDIAFAIEGMHHAYRAEPGGDWFARQARPRISLRLARAYAAIGDLDTAEALFASVTAFASHRSNLLPELIDPVTGSGYGARPCTTTAADYILTAEYLMLHRMNGESLHQQ